MSEQKISFRGLDTETPAFGIRAKSVEQNGKRFRLLELSKGLEHPDWCETGHLGYVVEGELDIEFADETVRYSKGDALFIKDGEVQKHIPKPVSEKVVLFLIDEV